MKSSYFFFFIVLFLALVGGIALLALSPDSNFSLGDLKPSFLDKIEASAVVEDAMNSQRYKVEQYNDIYLIAEKDHSCSWLPDSAKSNIKNCAPEFIIYNPDEKAFAKLPIDLQKGLFLFEPTKNVASYEMEYSTSYNTYLDEETNETFFVFDNWKPFDDSNKEIGSEEVMGVRFKFSIPKYQELDWNVTYTPKGALLDPTVSACGTLASPGVYTLDQNIESSGKCIEIDADDIILDCDGFIINSSLDTAGEGVMVTGGAQDNLTIRNCNFRSQNISVSTVEGIQFNSAVTNGLIVNNTFNMTYGGSSNAIELTNVNNANITIENNTIVAHSDGGASPAVELDGINLIFRSNNITSRGGAGSDYGLFIQSTANNITVEFNTIGTGPIPGDGNNNRDGIVSTGDNGVIRHNNVTVNSGGTNNDAITVGGDNWTIFNNTVSANGTGGDTIGISITNGVNHEIIRNRVNLNVTESGTGNAGIETSGSTTGTLILNNTIDIFSAGTSTFGIGISVNHNAIIKYNNISVNSSASSARGISVAGSNNVTVDSNVVQSGRTGALGIQLATVDNSTVMRNNITTYGPTANSWGIRTNTVSRTVFGNNIIFGTGTHSSSDALHIRGAGVELNFTNNTIITENIGGEDIETEVTAIGSINLVDQQIASYNINPASGTGFSVVKTGVGRILFLQDFSTTTAGTNFSRDISITPNLANVSSETEPGLNTSANVTFFNLPIDFVSPEIVVNNQTVCVSPLCNNFTSLNAGTVVFNVSNWSTYTINGSTGVVDNGINISFEPPTEASGVIKGQNFILTNVSVSAADGIENITIFLFNSSQNLVNISNSSTSSFFVNFSGLPAGLYFYNATAFDTDNDVNNTETRNITLLETAPPTMTNFSFFALNSSQNRLGTNASAFNQSNLQDIEYMNISFILSDPSNITGDITLFLTANGTGACSLGNDQSSVCFNFSTNTYIEFKNNTDTSTFIDTDGKGAGDSILCDYQQLDANTRNYTCQIDEHYNPNVWKHYPLNFTNLKLQSGATERIVKNTLWRINLTNLNIPNDADFYKMDFRVNATVGNTPFQPIEGFLCNSTYLTGDPSLTPQCQLVVSKLPNGLQNDGTKFRGLFTSNLTQTLGDIGFVVLTTDSAGGRYYSMFTYAYLGTEAIDAAISTDSGGSYTPLADGFETDLNINWFYKLKSDSNRTQTVIKIGANDSLGNNGNSSDQVMTWLLGDLNLPPIVDIIVPEVGENVSGTVDINWTTADPNMDSYTTNVTANNGTTNVDIDLGIPDPLMNTTWDTTAIEDGFWNITVESCEDLTLETFCGNATHQVLVRNAPLNTTINLTVDSPLNITYFGFFQLNLSLNVSVMNTTILSGFRYSLDGAANITFSPNTTFTISPGGHNMLVQVNDSNDNVSSRLIFFSFVEGEEDIYTPLTWAFLFAIVLAIFFVVLGYSDDRLILLILSGVLFIAVALEISLNNIASLGSGLIRDALVVVLIGVGFYLIIVPSMEDYRGRER